MDQLPLTPAKVLDIIIKIDAHFSGCIPSAEGCTPDLLLFGL
jgi:hypothetical protein